MVSVHCESVQSAHSGELLGFGQPGREYLLADSVDVRKPKQNVMPAPALGLGLEDGKPVIRSVAVMLAVLINGQPEGIAIILARDRKKVSASKQRIGEIAQRLSLLGQTLET